jgi:hypothetical protein
MPSKTATHLRRKIDGGEGTAKASSSDPAAAPLDLDFETAGTPLTAEQIEMARQAEIKARSQKNSHNVRHLGRARILIGFGLLLAGGLIAYALWTILA